VVLLCPTVVEALHALQEKHPLPFASIRAATGAVTPLPARSGFSQTHFCVAPDGWSQLCEIVCSPRGAQILLTAPGRNFTRGCYHWYPYMSEEDVRRLDISIVKAVGGCAETCIDDLLRKLAAHSSMALLEPRRQALIERTTSALLRIIVDESQTHDGEP
jgi:hypothetical protein